MRVLLIEDDEVVRDLIAEGLLDHGLDVSGLAFAEDALVLLGSGEPFDVLVTDIDLGDGLTGMDVAAVARARHPDIELIFISGRPTDREGRSPHPHEHLLLKPFRPSELIALIREATA
jgi:DNA-binding response OmpR family regulator